MTWVPPSLALAFPACERAPSSSSRLSRVVALLGTACLRRWLPGLTRAKPWLAIPACAEVKPGEELGRESGRAGERGGGEGGRSGGETIRSLPFLLGRQPTAEKEPSIKGLKS